MVKNSSKGLMEKTAMNEQPKVLEPSKLINVCGLNEPGKQCPLLRKINGTNILVCALKTYVDLEINKPNCQKS